MTTMGIIFANIYDSSLGELTNKRTMASLPYGGRYRQIDFSTASQYKEDVEQITADHITDGYFRILFQGSHYRCSKFR